MASVVRQRCPSRRARALRCRVRGGAPVPAAVAHIRAPSRRALGCLAVVASVACRGANATDAATASAATVAAEDGFRAHLDSAASVLTLELGPLPLGAAGSGRDMVIAAPRALALPIDGWLRSETVEVVDGAGAPLPRAMLHHVNLIAPERRELFSPIMLRLGAAGPETAPIVLPRGLGYRVHRGDSLLVTAMLHNPLPRAERDVRVRVRLAYTPVRRWLAPIGVFPFYLDVMPPAGAHAYDLPAGRSTRSWEGRPAIAGRVLGLGGHLHRYGVALRFEDVTAHRLLWEARPVRDSSGGVRAIPTATFLWRLGLPIRPDHTYRLTAVYDNPTGQMIPYGAMGALGGVFLPARGTIWAPVARADPQYQRDVRVTYDTTSMTAAHPAHHAMDDMGERGAPPAPRPAKPGSH